jgi:hypothetical protein
MFLQNIQKKASEMIKNILVCHECVKDLKEMGIHCLDSYFKICKKQSKDGVFKLRGSLAENNVILKYLEMKGYILTTECDEDIAVKTMGHSILKEEDQENHQFCAFPKIHLSNNE